MALLVVVEVWLVDGEERGLRVMARVAKNRKGKQWPIKWMYGMVHFHVVDDGTSEIFATATRKGITGPETIFHTNSGPLPLS